MQISFWGVRGSSPAPERSTWRYGGNTPCVEVRLGERLFVLDAGTGIRELGLQLGREFSGPGLTAHLFLTHYHWDHIQGLPFFEPLYFAGTTLHLFGPPPQVDPPLSFPGVLQVLFRAPFFPVQSRELSSSYPFQEVGWSSDFTVEEVRVRTCRLNHPQGAVAYRFDHRGAAVVYATDHEPGDPERDRELIDLARGADVLISDAQYLPEELAAGKKGWGHSSWRAATEFARKAKVKQLVLFHHDPARTDQELDDLVVKARQLFPRTWAASEGLLLDTTPQGVAVGSRANRLGQRHPVKWPASVELRLNGHRVREKIKLESLSFQGAYFLSPRPFELQDRVEIAFPGPLPADPALGKEDGPKDEVRLQGYVVRIEPQTSNGGWVGVAVLFPGVPPYEAAESQAKTPGPSQEAAPGSRNPPET